MVLANFAAQRTHRDMPERLRVKWDLTRRLYETGFSRKDILELYRLIDWLLRLPVGLEHEFKQQVRTYETSKTMPYVTSIEKLAKEEGRVEGRVEEAAELVLRLLRRRWPILSSALEQRVRALQLPRLEALAEAVLDLKSLADLEAWLSTP